MNMSVAEIIVPRGEIAVIPAGNKITSQNLKCVVVKKSVHQLDAESEYEDIDTVSVSNGINSVEDNTSSHELFADMILGDSSVMFQIHSGAAVNILPKCYAPKSLEPTNKILVMWNKAKVIPLGSCRVELVNPKNSKKYHIQFGCRRTTHTAAWCERVSVHGIYHYPQRKFPECANGKFSWRVGRGTRQHPGCSTPV